MLLIPGGQMVEVLNSVGSLTCDQVLMVFYQTCRAVQHMHKQKPPVVHRDLKVWIINWIWFANVWSCDKNILLSKIYFNQPKHILFLLTHAHLFTFQKNMNYLISSNLPQDWSITHEPIHNWIHTLFKMVV